MQSKSISLENVSNGFKILRKKVGLSQKELSELTGLEQPTISNIENARNFNVENFLILYNFYVDKINTDVVIANLFNNTTGVKNSILEQIKLLANKHQLELQNIINQLE